MNKQHWVKVIIIAITACATMTNIVAKNVQILRSAHNPQLIQRDSYNSFENQQYYQPIEILLQYDTADQPVFITVSKGGIENFKSAFSSGYQDRMDVQIERSLTQGYDRVARFEDNRLRYNIIANLGNQMVIKDLADVQFPEEAIIPDLTRSAVNPLPLTLYVTVPIGQIVAPGLYEDIVIIRLYEGSIDNIGQARLLQSIERKVAIPVQEVTQISYEDPYGNAISEIQFDTHNLTKEAFQIRVFSNTGYAIELTSPGGGILSAQRPSIKDKIPYKAYFNKKEIDLKKPFLYTAKTASGLSGDVYIINVELQEKTNILSGTYNDPLEIKLISR